MPPKKDSTGLTLSAKETQMLLAVIGQMGGVPDVDFEKVAKKIGVKFGKNARSSCKTLWAKLAATNTVTEDNEDDELAEATPVSKPTKSKANKAKTKDNEDDELPKATPVSKPTKSKATKAKTAKAKVAAEVEGDDGKEEAEDSVAEDHQPVTKKVTARATGKKGVGKTTAPMRAKPVKKVATTGKGRGRPAGKVAQAAPRITPDMDVKYGEEDVEEENERFQVEEDPVIWPADIEESIEADATMSGVEEDNEPYDEGDEGESYPIPNRYVSPHPDVRTVTVHNTSVLYTEWDRQQAKYHDMPLAAYVEWKLRNPYPFPDTPS